MYFQDSPPSASIHEEATTSTVVPFMGLYNNLVLFDQQMPQNSLDTIRPDLAESWAWSADGTQLTFKLRQGVEWHDGKPFTSADVKCTWDMLTGKGETQAAPATRAPHGTGNRRQDHDQRRLRGHLPPRRSRSPPSWCCSPRATARSIPATSRPTEMRTKPVGTGPFKLAEFKAEGASCSSRRNTDYLKKGQPYLDGIDISIVPARVTAILGFVTQPLRHDGALCRHHPAAQGHQGAGAPGALRDRGA